MSKNFQLPTQKGTGPKFDQVMQQPTKLVIHGVDIGSPLEQAVIGRYGGALRQFHSQQQQQYSLSENLIHKKSADWGEAQATYTNIHGQETLELSISAEALKALEAPESKNAFDLEAGGYIYFAMDRFPGDPYPVSFSFKMNGVELFSYTFSDFHDNSFRGVVTFGSNALHYHSFNDGVNEVTQKFIAYPTPKYRDPKYSELGSVFFTGSTDADGLILLPYYVVFRTPGGVLGAHNMTWWDGANTPLLLDGAAPNQNRFIGGGVKAYDNIGSSPLIPVGLNSFTIETSSSARLLGQMFGEFFSRSTRQVIHSWRQTRAPSSTLRMNDQPVYISAALSNEVSLGHNAGFMGQAQWYDCYNTLPGVIAAPPASTPTDVVDDPTTPVTTLILDLRK